jgi:hypothetical protein
MGWIEYSAQCLGWGEIETSIRLARICLVGFGPRVRQETVLRSLNKDWENSIKYHMKLNSDSALRCSTPVSFKYICIGPVGDKSNSSFSFLMQSYNPINDFR